MCVLASKTREVHIRPTSKLSNRLNNGGGPSDPLRHNGITRMHRDPLPCKYVRIKVPLSLSPCEPPRMHVAHLGMAKNPPDINPVGSEAIDLRPNATPYVSIDEETIGRVRRATPKRVAYKLAVGVKQGIAHTDVA